MAKRKIAGKTEVLKLLTDIMRGEETAAKPTETMKAAELIGKSLGMFSDKSKNDGGINVTIVDDIPQGDDTNE